jgi:hypothetical protein
MGDAFGLPKGMLSAGDPWKRTRFRKPHDSIKFGAMRPAERRRNAAV